MPTEIHLRPGAIGALRTIARQLGAANALLVTDPGVVATGLADRARCLVADRHVRVHLFDRIEPNPRHTTIDSLARVARDQGNDLVVGLGGGSVLDAAKAAAIFARNPVDTCADKSGRIEFAQPALPFVAIPTTCGTGSEVTWVSVITDETRRTKFSVKGPAMFPMAALVDADLLKTLPQRLVAYTGLDALTHAIEATTCRAANAVSDALAEKAITLLFAFLERAVADIAGDDEAREAVMRASTLAGMAFGNADVAGVHCISESLGGMYDVPHGLANAMFLAPLMRFHAEATQPQLARIARVALPDAPAADAAAAAIGVIEHVEKLVARLEVPSFTSLDVPETDFDEIARAAEHNGSNGSNPRPMTAADYRALLAAAAKT